MEFPKTMGYFIPKIGILIPCFGNIKQNPLVGVPLRNFSFLGHLFYSNQKIGNPQWFSLSLLTFYL